MHATTIDNPESAKSHRFLVALVMTANPSPHEATAADAALSYVLFSPVALSLPDCSASAYKPMRFPAHELQLGVLEFGMPMPSGRL